ncbi:MAG: AsmA family protein [Gammaproteobacteria bacterium]|jgi:AsmA protein|nr:AsmA family protein [Gammaproteobacteria bacterium]
MKKPLKLISLFIGILLLLVIFFSVCVVTFVNPNRFKPLIVEQAMKYTGRQLTMDGDLSWTFFPYFGVKTGHILLGNPEGFTQKTFAEINHATIGIRLFPLFHKKIESSGIMLDGLKLNLITEVNGQKNWQFQNPVNTVNNNNPPEYFSQRSKIKQLSVGLAISGFDIKNAEVNWINRQNNQSVSIEKLAFHAKNVSLLNPFSIKGEFNFFSKNPALSGHIAFTDDISMNLDQQVFSCRNFVLNATVQQGNKKFNGKITGDMVADLSQQTIEWSHFRGQLENLALTGKIDVVDLASHPHVTGHLQIQPFGLNELPHLIKDNLANIQMLKNARGDIDFTTAMNGIDVQGKLNIDAVQINHLTLNNIVIPVRYQIGVLELSTVTANFYKGALQTNIKVNLTGAVPQIATQGRLVNVQVAPLLHDLGANQKLTFTGIGNIDFQTTTQGLDANILLKNLNGISHISFNQGTLQGIDFAYLLDSAYAFAKQKPLTTTNTHQTDFGNLTATILIQEGVLINNDLVMDSPRFKTTGKGNLNLVNKKIDYHLQVFLNKLSVNQRNDWGNLYGLAIPIRVVGDVQNPTISLDTAALAQEIAQEEIKKVQLKVKEQLQDKVKGKAGKLLQDLLGQ